MVKKIIAISLLVLLPLLSFCGCGSQSDNSDSSNTSSVVSTREDVIRGAGDAISLVKELVENDPNEIADITDTIQGAIRAPINLEGIAVHSHDAQRSEFNADMWVVNLRIRCTIRTEEGYGRLATDAYLDAVYYVRSSTGEIISKLYHDDEIIVSGGDAFWLDLFYGSGNNGES